MTGTTYPASGQSGGTPLSPYAMYGYGTGQPAQWTGQTQPNQSAQNVPMFQPPVSNNFDPYLGANYKASQSTIPGRTVFSPDQITPQDIPTNGTQALFPLSDGSCIIAYYMLPNGDFAQKVYRLEQAPQVQGNSEFNQVMAALSSISATLTKVVNDLYGQKNDQNKEEKKNG